MLNIGIIGAGSIAQGHEREISKLDDCKITAVCDIRLDAVEEMAKRHGAQAYENYHDLLKTDVDMVYICTPPHLHAEMAIASAESGKHIFLEKPLTLSIGDGYAIKEAIDKANVRCQLGYVIGFNPSDDTARRALEDGKIGALTVAFDQRMSGASYLTKAIGTYRDWLVDKERSGGVLIECMTHEVAWLISLGGEVDTVYANIQYTYPDPRVTVDDNCWAILKFKNGGIGVLGTSWSDPIGHFGKGILGVDGAIGIEQGKITLVSSDGAKQEIMATADDELSKQAAFNKCIRENLPNRNSIDEAIYNLEVMLAMHESSETNTVVKIEN